MWLQIVNLFTKSFNSYPNVNILTFCIIFKTYSVTYLDHLEAGICESVWEEREENIWEMFVRHAASIHLSGCAEPQDGAEGPCGPPNKS